MSIKSSLPFATIYAFVILVLAVISTKAYAQLIELVNIPCEDKTKESSKCGAGGAFNGDGAFSGTMVCRNTWTTFFTSEKKSVCTPTVLGQVIGYEEDTCGCCNGECPPPCTCACDASQDKVLVGRKRTLFGDAYECMSRGKASRSVGDGTNNYFCVPDEDCPALETEPDRETKEATGREVESEKSNSDN